MSRQSMCFAIKSDNLFSFLYRLLIPGCASIWRTCVGNDPGCVIVSLCSLGQTNWLVWASTSFSKNKDYRLDDLLRFHLESEICLPFLALAVFWGGFWTYYIHITCKNRNLVNFKKSFKNWALNYLFENKGNTKKFTNGGKRENDSSWNVKYNSWRKRKEKKRIIW